MFHLSSPSGWMVSGDSHRLFCPVLRGDLVESGWTGGISAFNFRLTPMMCFEKSATIQRLYE